MLLQLLGLILITSILLIGLYFLALEIQYRDRPGNKLVATVGQWQIQDQAPNHYRLVGEMELINQTAKLEIMVPQIEAEVKLLSGGSLRGVTTQTHVVSRHPDETARPDDYWFAYIVKVGKRTRVEVQIEIHGDDLSQLKAAWVQVHYLTYGPQGRIPKTRHIVVPFQFSDPAESKIGDRLQRLKYCPFGLTY